MIKDTPNPHLKLLQVNINSYLKSVVDKHFENKSDNLSLLDIGGRPGQFSFKGVKEYKTLDLHSNSSPNTIIGDITQDSLDLGQKFDIIASKNVFEHILNPWDATQNILNHLNDGGIYIMCAPFSWRYHSYPYDCYRYTHVGAQYLIERKGGMKKVSSGYYYLPDNELNRGKGHWKNKKDATMDGKVYRNNIQVFYIGERSSDYSFDASNLDSNFTYGN